MKLTFVRVSSSLLVGFSTTPTYSITTAATRATVSSLAADDGSRFQNGGFHPTFLETQLPEPLLGDSGDFPFPTMGSAASSSGWTPSQIAEIAQVEEPEAQEDIHLAFRKKQTANKDQHGFFELDTLKIEGTMEGPWEKGTEIELLRDESQKLVGALVRDPKIKEAVKKAAAASTNTGEFHVDMYGDKYKYLFGCTINVPKGYVVPENGGTSGNGSGKSSSNNDVVLLPDAPKIPFFSGNSKTSRGKSKNSNQYSSNRFPLSFRIPLSAKVEDPIPVPDNDPSQRPPPAVAEGGQLLRGSCSGVGFLGKSGLWALRGAGKNLRVWIDVERSQLIVHISDAVIDDIQKVKGILNKFGITKGKEQNVWFAMTFPNEKSPEEIRSKAYSEKKEEPLKTQDSLRVFHIKATI